MHFVGPSESWHEKRERFDVKSGFLASPENRKTWPSIPHTYQASVSWSSSGSLDGHKPTAFSTQHSPLFTVVCLNQLGIWGYGPAWRYIIIHLKCTTATSRKPRWFKLLTLAFGWIHWPALTAISSFMHTQWPRNMKFSFVLQQNKKIILFGLPSCFQNHTSCMSVWQDSFVHHKNSLRQRETCLEVWFWTFI